MVDINRSERVVRARIIYYGPAAGGKTTNLQVLHRRADPGRRGELLSVNSTQDRTILMDLLPVKTVAFGGFDLRFQVIAVPGQPAYAASRALLLDGADAIVFVANSAADRWEETLQSFREMNKNLLAHGLDPSVIPVVFQYNKQDLPELTPLDAMERTLNARRSESFPAVAVQGTGVLETFAAALEMTMSDLATRYQIGEGLQNGRRLKLWADESLEMLFGWKPGIESAPAPEPQNVPSLKVQVPVATSAGAEGLEKSYAAAAASLATELEELREERDRALRCLRELSAPIDAAHEILSGVSPDQALHRLLERVGDGLGAHHGELVLLRPDGTPERVVLHHLGVDPLFAGSAPGRVLLEAKAPTTVSASEPGALADVLASVGAGCEALVAIPVRTPIRTLGLLCFYLDAGAALPSGGTMAHLTRLGESLAMTLELASGTVPALPSAAPAAPAAHVAPAVPASAAGALAPRL